MKRGKSNLETMERSFQHAKKTKKNSSGTRRKISLKILWERKHGIATMLLGRILCVILLMCFVRVVLKLLETCLRHTVIATIVLGSLQLRGMSSHPCHPSLPTLQICPELSWLQHYIQMMRMLIIDRPKHRLEKGWIFVTIWPIGVTRWWCLDVAVIFCACRISLPSVEFVHNSLLNLFTILHSSLLPATSNKLSSFWA